jgi:hypothetical protein
MNISKHPNLILSLFAMLFVFVTNGEAQQPKNAGWLRLNVPVSDPGMNAQGTQGKSFFSLVVLPFGKICCYEGDQLSKGITYNLASQTLRSFLTHKNRSPDANVFFIKGVPEAYYSDLVTLIRLLNETKTKFYVLTALTQPEQQKLAAQPDSLIAVEPRPLPDTIAVRPSEAILLLEFRGNALLLVQKTAQGKKEITSVSTDQIETLETNIAEALRDIAGIHTRVCIAGHKATSYASFKTLVDLLRRQAWYRYDLLVKS